MIFLLLHVPDHDFLLIRVPDHDFLLLIVLDHEFLLILFLDHEFLLLHVPIHDLSLDSHTAEYLAGKIEEIIEKVGPERISAVVSDNAANIRKARTIINQKYPTIESIRCISHCINLIASDIAGHKFAKHLLSRVN